MHIRVKEAMGCSEVRINPPSTKVLFRSFCTPLIHHAVCQSCLFVSVICICSTASLISHNSIAQNG